MNAIAATLGLTPEYRASLFDKIIPSVQGGNYNVGMSSFTDSKKREEQVDFVTYFSAGSAWAQKVGAGINPEDACGKKIAVQTATVQDTDELPARSEKCVQGRQACHPGREVRRPDCRHQCGHARAGCRHAGRFAGDGVRDQAEQRKA